MKPTERAERTRKGATAIVSLVMAAIYNRFGRLLEKDGVLVVSTSSGAVYYCTICGSEKPQRLRAMKRSRKGRGGPSRRLMCPNCHCVYVPSSRVKMHPEEEGGDWFAYLTLDVTALRV